MNEVGSELCDEYWELLGIWGPLKLIVEWSGGRGGGSRVRPSFKWDVGGR